VVHYHGGLPQADPVTMAARRHNLGRAARVLFTSREQALPWLASGVLPNGRQVAEVAETSTTLVPWPQARARALTGIRGDPACVMVGRLDRVKDPLTTLAGFALVAERRPLARLYVYSQQDTLRPQLEAVVAATPALAGRVAFRGRAEHADMAAVMSSADFLLQSSRREWSGLAVLEAMACGAIPVLSDIPAFRKLTADGRYGRLFPVGDAPGLARAVLSLGPAARAALRPELRRHFERSLSFRALAGDLETVYREVLERV
jgi:glycosyltransferase involved in cell wall biosynthesis